MVRRIVSSMIRVPFFSILKVKVVNVSVTGTHWHEVWKCL